MAEKYAVVKTGGKQYRVSEGEIFRVEKLDDAAGAAVSLSEVLLVVDDDQIKLGRPHVEGASVQVEVVDEGLGRKALIYKYRRRKRYRRKVGHRQPYTMLKVTSIQA